MSGEEYKARIKDYKSQLNPLIIDINYVRTIYNMAKTELKLRHQNFSKGQIDSLWNSSFYHKVELYTVMNQLKQMLILMMNIIFIALFFNASNKPVTVQFIDESGIVTASYLVENEGLEFLF